MAGLVIDASSPNASEAGGPGNPSFAFTPPADAMFLVTWAGDTQAGDPGAPSVASSPSQTWTQDVWDHLASGSPSLPGQAAIWHAVVTGSPGSTVVTATNGQTGANYASISKVWVLTGHDPVAPIGVTGGGRQDGGGSLSDSYVASISGGQGFMVVCDWAAGATGSWAPASGCTIQDTGTMAGSISYAVVRRTSADGVFGATTTLGITGLLAGGQYHWAYAEVISLEAAIAAAQAAGYPSFGANAPMF